MQLHRSIPGRLNTGLRPVLSPCRALVTKDVELPNGLIIRCTSTADEALFLYREHAVERVYLRNGVTLQPGDTVVDVGANAALFAMSAAEACGPSGRVVCFEPIPEVAAACRENLQRHAAWCAARGISVAPAQVVEAAIGDGSTREADFTVYPRASGWSTMSPDDNETLNNMGSYLEARLEAVREANKVPRAVATDAVGTGSKGGGNNVGSSGLEEQPVGALERLLLPAAAALHALPWARGPLRAALRLYVQAVMLSGAQRVRCKVVPLRDALQELGIERVSLLKVDCERAELDVLRGIGAADWPRIDQVALEVHDLPLSGSSMQPTAGAADAGDLSLHGSSSGVEGPMRKLGSGREAHSGVLTEVQALLAGIGGFDCILVDQDTALKGTTLYNVYATRGHKRAST